MLELLVLAVTRILVVGLRGESSQAFMIDEYAQRIDSEDCDVNAQIELEIVDEEGIIDIVADDE